MCKRKALIYDVGNVLSSCSYWKKSLEDLEDKGSEDKLYKGQHDLFTGGLVLLPEIACIYYWTIYLPKHGNYECALKQRVSQQLLYSTRH